MDLVDLHTHAIAPVLPDLEAAAPWGRLPSVPLQDPDRAAIGAGNASARPHTR